MIFEIDNFPIKKYGSQGQQKSFLIALKLAQFDYLKTKSNSSPILLLDDIFDKLDNKRVKELIKLVNDDEFGQPTKSIYGDCKKDQGSNFSTSTSALYICSDGQINSYDYWVTDEEFMWKMKCVWREDQFEAINQRLLKVEKINSSDTCRKSFESFKSQVN